MLEKLLERKCIIVIGRVGGRREGVAKRIVEQAAAKGLSTTVLDTYGLFSDIPLEPVKPLLPYRLVSTYLPLVLPSLPGPRTSSAEVAAADAVADSSTLSGCLAKLASRADVGARIAYLKLSMLSAFITDSEILPKLDRSRIELAVAPTMFRKALTLLWISYFKSLNKPPPNVIVIGEGGLTAQEGEWVWPILEELAMQGAVIVLLDRAVRRQHLQYTIVLADITQEARMGVLKYRLPVPPEDMEGRKVVVVEGGASSYKIDF